MKVGLICEGHSDRAVIENILNGFCDVDSSDIIPLRPQELLDETSKTYLMDESEFSTGSLVKKECEEKELIEDFLLIEGNEFIIIHFDTAEVDEYLVHRPAKNKDNHNYCFELRQNVVSKIDEWLEEQYIIERTIHAVSIEEIEAWILTIYINKNTCSYVSPKEKLKYELKKKNIPSHVKYDNYKILSSDFSKSKKIKKGNFLTKNCSLNLFIEEAKTKLT